MTATLLRLPLTHAANHAAASRCLSTPALRVTAKSVRGPRNADNEDAYLALSQQGLFAVSDGMGGHAGGRIASRLAIDTLYRGFSDSAYAVRGAELIEDLVQTANRQIFARGQQDAGLNGMGCTIAVVLIKDGELHCWHVGDSRIYRLRDYRLELLTEDHNAAPRDLGQATAGPEPHHALTRALGPVAEVALDRSSHDWDEGDCLLLVSDGITDCVPDFVLTNLLVQEGGPAAHVNAVIRAAIDNAGDDDKTVVLIESVPNTAQ